MEASNLSQSFPHLVSPPTLVGWVAIPDRVWFAAAGPMSSTEPHVLELSIRDVQGDKWIAFEQLSHASAADVVGIFEIAARDNDLPDVLITQGKMFRSATFTQWADRYGVRIEDNQHRTRVSDFEPRLLAGPALPDLGRRVATRHPRGHEFYLFNVTLTYLTVLGNTHCVSSVVHLWDGEPHRICLAFDPPLLRALLRAGSDSETLDQLARWDGEFPRQIRFARPMKLSVLECALAAASARSTDSCVPFRVSQVRLDRRTTDTRPRMH